jgi:autotransporter-associated beta strand protein
MDGQGGTDVIYPAIKLTGPQTWLVGENSSSAIMALNDFYGNATDLVLCGPLSGTGGIIKKGTGRVYYANNTAPIFTGGLTVQGYSLEWALTNLQMGGKFRFGPDPITLDGGYFCFGASDTDRKIVTEEDNPILITDKGGMIEYSIEGKPERLPLITYSGPIHLGGLLKLAHSTIGWSNSGLEIAGPITLDQKNYSTLAIVSGDFSTGWTFPPKVSGSIHDGAGESGNPLILRSFMSDFSFTGTQNDYAGPTVIDMCGDVTWGGAEDATVSFGSNTVVGRGNLDLLPGARVQLSSPQNLSSTATVSLTSNTADLSALTLGFNHLPSITRDSSGGVLCIEVPVFDAVKDMSMIGDGTLRLSSVHGGIFSGDTLRPGAGNRYRFGGGIVYGAAALTIEHGVLAGSAGVEMGSTAWWGNGNLVLKGANSFCGPLVLQGFTMTDNGSYSSSLDGIAQTGANESPFGAADGAVVLHTSVLKLTGATGGQAVSKGLLTFEGNPTVTLDGSAGPSHLNVADIKRSDRSVFTINAVKGDLGEKEQFQVTGWSAHSGLQSPYLVYEQDASHLDFLSYDGRNGTGFHRFSDYVTDLKKAGATDAVEVGATQLNGETLTIAALKTTGPITGSGTIHITGGGLLAGGDITADIDFGNAEGIIHGWPALKGKVSGTNGLTFSTSFCASERSIRTASLSNSGNDFTGTVTIEGVRLDAGYDVFGSDGRAQLGSLGNLANNIVLNGGGLVFSKPLAMTDEKIGLAASRTVTLGPSGGLINSPLGPIYLAARVTGPGMLTEPGELSGPLIIENPDNDYTGGTRLLLGAEAMTATSTGKLGKGPVEIDAESWLNLQGDHNIDPHACLHVSQESIVNFFSRAPEIGSLIGGGLICLSGPDTNLSVGSDDTSFTFYGILKDQTGAANPSSGSLTKVGIGAWTLYNNQAYSGPTTIAAGSLILKGAVRGDVIVSGQGTLGGSGIIGGNLSVHGGNLSPEVGGSVLRIKGDAVLDGTSSFHVTLSGQKAGLLDVGGKVILDGS